MQRPPFLFFLRKQMPRNQNVLQEDTATSAASDL